MLLLLLLLLLVLLLLSLLLLLLPLLLLIVRALASAPYQSRLQAPLLIPIFIIIIVIMITIIITVTIFLMMVADLAFIVILWTAIARAVRSTRSGADPTPVGPFQPHLWKRWRRRSQAAAPRFPEVRVNGPR